MSENKENQNGEKEGAIKSPGFWGGKMGKFTIILILAVLLWNSVQIWLMSGVVSSVNKYNLGAVDEMGKVVGDVKEFADDLNEIRRFLLLPEHDYSINGGTAQADTAGMEQNTEDSVALFNFLDSLKKEETIAANKEKARPVWEAFFSSPELTGLLQENELLFGERNDFEAKFLDNQALLADGTINENKGLPLFSLVFSPEENLFRVQSVLGDKDFADYEKETFSAEVLDYFKGNASSARQKKIEDALEAQKKVDEAVVKQAEEMEKQKKQLEALVSDKVFQEMIVEMGLKVAEKPREELNKQIYDVFDQNGKVRFSLALEISSGQIKIIRDNQEIDLTTFLGNDGSKKKL